MLKFIEFQKELQSDYGDIVKWGIFNLKSVFFIHFNNICVVYIIIYLSLSEFGHGVSIIAHATNYMSISFDLSSHCHENGI